MSDTASWTPPPPPVAAATTSAWTPPPPPNGAWTPPPPPDAAPTGPERDITYDPSYSRGPNSRGRSVDDLAAVAATTQGRGHGRQEAQDDVSHAMAAAGDQARSESPWMGHTRDAPVNELLAQTDTGKAAKGSLGDQEKAMSARWDAARKTGTADAIDQAQNIGHGDTKAGGVQDVLAGAAKTVTDIVGGTPQLTRTLARAMELPADARRLGEHIAGHLSGQEVPDRPDYPGAARLGAMALREVADDIEPDFLAVAKKGGAIADAYMTPEFKASISKPIMEGVKDPMWWENQAATAALFMASDGALVGGVTRSAYMTAAARTAEKLAGETMQQSVRNSVIEAAAQKAALKAGMISSAAFNGVAIGGSTGQQVRDTINDLDESTLMKFDSYRQDREAGIPDKVARAKLADDRSAMATVISGTAAGLSGAALGSFISHMAVGLKLSKGVVGSVAKSTAEAGAAGAVQTVGTAAAERAGTSANFADFTKQEREGALSDAIGGAISFAPLGVLGAFHATKPDINKIKDNANSSAPGPGIKEAGDNLAKAHLALQRIEAALDDPRIPVDYNELDRARKTREAALKDFIKAGENAGIIGEDKDGISKTKQLDGSQGSPERAGGLSEQRVSGQPTGQRGPRGQAQREAASGQQPEDERVAEVPEKAGREAERVGLSADELRRSATEVELGDGQLSGRRDQGPEHLGVTGPLESEPKDRQIVAGKPHITLKPRMPGELGVTGPLEPEQGKPVKGKLVVKLKPVKEGGFEPPKTTTPEAAKNIAAIPPPNYPLSGAETAVAGRMKRIVANVDAAEIAYAKIPDSDGGSVINTDNIREMSPDFAASVKSRSRYSNAVQEPSSWLADQLYTRRLKKPVREGKDDKVFFTAGGPDSGKSVSLGSKEAQSADMIYDGNMNNLVKARRRVGQALDSGRSVDIQYHARDPIQSFQSMLMRAMKMGRTVPIEAHAAAFNDSFKTVRALARQYAGNKRVRFHVIDVDKFKESTLDAVADKFKKVTPEQLHKLAAEEYKNGRITEAVFRGVSGRRAERLVGRGEDNGRLPAQPVEAAGQGQHPLGEAGAGAEGHERGGAGDRVGAQEKDQLGKDVPGKVQIAFKVGEDGYRGGVRELSYDPKFAATHGQTEAEIRAAARRKQTPEQRLTLRAGLLKFLGLKADVPGKRVADLPVGRDDRVRYRIDDDKVDRRPDDLERNREIFSEWLKKAREKWQDDDSRDIIDNAARRDTGKMQYRVGEAADQTKTPEFKKWFGESKITENIFRGGNEPEVAPKVVYHGTRADIDAFKNTGDHFGFHFGTVKQANRRLRSRESKWKTKLGNEGKNIVPAYLNLKNPLRVTDAGDWGNGFQLSNTISKALGENADGPLSRGVTNIFEERNRAYESTDMNVRVAAQKQAEANIRAFIGPYLESKGYDGLVYKNRVEGRGDSYVALRPEQIKSAVGNHGMFDSGDPRLAYRTDAHDYHNAAFMSAERYDMTAAQNARRTVNLAAALRRAGLVPKDGEGRYTDDKGVTSGEASFMVHPTTEAHVDAIRKLAARFKQESVMFTHNGEAALHYTADGSTKKIGYIREAAQDEAEKRSAYTRLADGRHLVTDEEDHGPEMAKLDADANALRASKGWMSKVEDLGGTAYERLVVRQGGMPRHELSGVIRHMVRRFGVPVDIAEHPRDVPGISRWDAENLPIHGVFIDDVNGGRIVLFRQNLGSARQARIAAYHEIVGHHGLRGILGDHYNEVMDALAKNFSQHIPEMAKRNGINLATEGDIGRRSAAEELVAYASERRMLQKEQRGTWNKIVDFVRDHLQRIGVLRDADKEHLDDLVQSGANAIWTRSDIDSLIDHSAKALRRGVGRTLRERDLLSRRITGQTRQYASGEKEERWHSGLTKAVEDMKQGAASPEQWQAAIKNLSGVKKEEIEWSGIHDHLEMMKDYPSWAKSMPKEDVLQYLRSQQVQLGETNLGEHKPINRDSKYYTPEVARVVRENGGLGNTTLDIDMANDHDAFFEIKGRFPELFKKGSEPDPGSAPAGEEPWFRHVLKDLGWSGKTQTAYHRENLNVPGGENYRERLLTIPGTSEGGHDPNLDFESPHWIGQGNIMAHVRYDERTDAEGKRNLFIQEVQSDWHQKGRSQGYRQNPDAIAKLTAEGVAKRAAAKVALEGADNLGFDTTSDAMQAVVQNDDWADRWPDTTQEQFRAIDEFRTAWKAVSKAKTAVADAPFKTTWHELALKRMIQHAAEGGFDRLSWTTGDTQAARYDLSKHVASVSLMDGNDGSKRLTVFDKSGEKVADIMGAKDSEIESWVGKDTAMKLLAQEAFEGRRHISGLDLKIGGEGMRGFYDKMLPAAAEKLTKKFGGKVSRRKIAEAETPSWVSGDDVLDSMGIPYGERQAKWAAMDQAERDRLMDLYRAGVGEFTRPAVEAHVLDITPEMRAAATAGGPLRAMFKVGDSQREAREILTPIAKHLTEEEKTGLTRAAAGKILSVFKKLPDTKEFAAAALAGKAKRGWYKESAEAIANVFGPDSPRFSALLSAMSPQVSIESNLHNALHTFINWDKAGRPTDRKSIIKIMGDSVQGNKLADSVLPAWINNTVRALIHDSPEKLIISGPKVNSFMRNLQGHVNEVTLDAWMANFARVNQKQMFGGALNKRGPGKGAGYLGYSAKIREAAEMVSKLTGETWTPAEVQETIWSWAKTAYETADSYKGLASVQDLVKDKELTDELIRSTPDFKTLFHSDAYEPILRGAGYGSVLDDLHAAQEKPASAGKASKAAEASLQPHLLKAAARLEGLRQDTNQQRVDTRRANAQYAVGGQHDPELESFLGKINPDKRSLTERIGDFVKNIRSEAELQGDKLMQWGIDKTWGIQRAWRIGNKDGPNLGRMSARLSANHAGLMDAIVRYGRPTWQEDAPAIVGHTGFQDILAPLGKNVNSFFAALVARRAGRLMNEGRENLFTREEIAAGNKLWEQHPEFENAYRELASFKKSVLDFAMEAGVINPNTRALWEHDDYVPFFRMMNEQGELGGPGAGRGLGRVGKQIHRLSGGTAALGDPMENMLRNWDSLMKSSLRTKALQLTVDSLADTGLLERYKPPGGTTLSRDAFRQQLSDQGIDPDRVTGDTFNQMYEHAAFIPEDKRAVWLWRNGVKEHYLVHDPVLFRALTNMNSNGRSQFQEQVMRVLSLPKRVATTAIVKSPVFIAKVLARHSFLQFLSGHQGETGKTQILPDFIPVWDTAKGIYKIMANTDESRDLAAAGGTFVGAHGSEQPKNIARRLRIRQGMETGGAVLDTVLKASNFYNKLLSATEGTHRLAVAQAVEKEGGNRVQQAFAARNVLDYSKGGDSAFVQFFLDTVPFLKAGISGASSAYELSVHNPVGFMVRGGALALAAVAYAYYHKDNERYKALTNDQKINYYHFYDVFQDGDHWQVPKGFDSADIVTTIPEALTDLALSSEDDRVSNAASMVGDVLWHQIAMGGMPAILSPALDVVRNKQSYSGAPILNQADLSVAPQAQDAPYVSPTYRGIATHMPEFMPDWTKSPKVLQYLGTNYFATLGQFATAATDLAINKGQGVSAPSRGFPQDIPAVSQVYSTGPSRRTKYSDAMYAYAKKVDMEAETYKKFVKGGDIDRALDYQEKHADDIMIKPAMDQIVKQVGSLQKQQRAIQQDPDLDGKTKQAQIDEVQEIINDLAHQAYDLRPGGSLSPFQASKLIGANRATQVKLLQSYGLPATAGALQSLA